VKIFEQRSELQLITLTHEAGLGVTLLLDEMPQLSETIEYRYHECLAVAPALFGAPRTVFVGGGGDGLAATRLLRMDSVERIVLCDYDPLMTQLATEQEDLVRMNGGSMADPRVEVINADAVAWLEATSETFDLIICDFPDPYFPELGRLYTVELFQLVFDRLTETGTMITQTLAIPEVTRIIRAGVRATFPHEGYFRGDSGAGFTLGSKRPLERREPVPDWAMYISDGMADALFVLPRDVEAELSPDETSPATGDGLAVVKAAIARGMAPLMAEPHPYLPNATEVYLTKETAERITDGQIGLLLEGLAERRRLIVVVSADLTDTFAPRLEAMGYSRGDKSYEHYRAPLTQALKDHHAAYWARVDDGSVTDVEARTCRPDEDETIKALLERYLRDHGHRFYDAPGSRFDFNARGRYVVTRGADEQPVGFFKLLEKEDGRVMELEILYGVGSPRQHLLSLILVVNYLDRIGAGAVECYVPAGVFGKSLKRLGAEKIDTLHTYIA